MLFLRLAPPALACLILSACVSSPAFQSGYQSGYSSAQGGNYRQCGDCGVITRIEAVQTGSAAPAGTGAVIGGIVGAVAAREVARNQTDSEGRRNTATVAGAAGGAAAGHAIQNRLATRYNIHVRMNNGHETVVTQNSLGMLREGSQVRVGNGRVWAY